MTHTKTCIVCQKKPAKLPAASPMFCTLHCGFTAGVNSYASHSWCAKHQDWHDAEGCTPCWLEELEREKSREWGKSHA